MDVEVAGSHKHFIVAVPILALQLITLNSYDEELFENRYRFRALTWRSLVDILARYLSWVVE